MNPSLPPGFPVIDAQQIVPRCDAALTQRRAMMAAMEARSGPDGILEEFNALAIQAGSFDDPLSVLQNAAPDKATRDAAQSCLDKLAPFGTELFQSEKIYARVAALEPKDEQDRSYREQLIEAFEDTGVTLPPEKRARAKQIQDELITLELQFGANVNDVMTTVPVTPAEAAGLPDSLLRSLRRDARGDYLISMDFPVYEPFLRLAQSEEARRRVWTAYQNRAGLPNLRLMDQALALRHELAQLYGHPDYATFSLRRKMAGTPQAVETFLYSVKSAVEAVELRELADLQQEKAALLGLPTDAVRVERWDVAYLQNRIEKKRFDIDQESLRAFFPTEASVRYVMHLAETLYGIRFVARPDLPGWSPDVRYYDVVDMAPDGSDDPHGAPDAPTAPIGGIYLDLFPREGKFKHAAAFSVRSGSVLGGQTPIKALLCNLDPNGLTHVELETLLHEFGHILHGVLSRARYADQSGTNVRLDFVEVPSQMFEEWGRRAQPLARFAQACPECPRLTPEQVARLDDARRFGSGLRYARQWLYAAYDMALHTGPVKSALATWKELEGATPLGHVAGTMMPASFGHLMGGYEAGYYSYMWSEVLALDMLSAFRGDLLDPTVGHRYRQWILEPGGSRPPEELAEGFLGRKPDAEAFYQEIRGTR